VDRVSEADRPKVEDLKFLETWTGTYRDVRFKVARWTSDAWPGDPSHPIWNYYLYVGDWQLPEDKLAAFDVPLRTDDLLPRRPFWDYWGLRKHLDFHGGITWFEKFGGRTPEESKVFEIGCDYNHTWDRECRYSDTLESILADCCHTIDSLWEFVPDLKPRYHSEEAQP